MEIEAKYAVLDTGTAADLAERPRLAGFRLTPAETRSLTDTYLDTRDYALMAAGYACRRRLREDVATINVKGLGKQEGTIHRRQEIAVRIDDETVMNPALWPESGARSLVQELALGEKLRPLFDLAQERRIRNLVDGAGNAIAELSLDTVAGSGKGWAESYEEVEIELLSAGTEEQLMRIVATVAELPGLSPQPTSKFERGMAMAHQRTGIGAAIALGNVLPDDTMGQATRKLLRPLFLRMQMHEAGTYLGQDPEELHDMRVMTRRMRTAYRMAVPWVDDTGLDWMRKGLRRTARILGVVRDMDVFRQKTELYLEQTGTARDRLMPLIAAWDGEYARRRNELLDHLTSNCFGAFKQHMWRTLSAPLPDRANPVRVRQAIPSVVEGQLQVLLAQGRLIEQEDAPLTVYHRLRIDVKQLRYTLRFFRDVLGPSAAAALDVLETLQDTFGDLQDAVVATTHLRAVLATGTWVPPHQSGSLWREWAGNPSPPRADLAGVADYLVAREAEIATLKPEARALWQHFNQAQTPQSVRRALAALA